MIRLLGFGDNVVDKYEHLKVMYPGGNSLNFSVFAKKNDADAAYMGIFGDDNEAEHVIRSLQDLDIETFKCKQYPGENGCAHVTLENGERVFLKSNEGGIRKNSVYELDRFDIEYIKSFDLVHTGNYSYTETQLKKIKDAKVKLSFDFSDDSDDSYISEIAPFVDFAFISCGSLKLEEARQKIMMIHEFGCEIVVGLMGADGAIAYDGESFYFQESISTDIVDTMGAGDAFIGSFLTHYIKFLKKDDPQRKKEDNIRKCLLEGAIFASKICGVDGSFGYGEKY